MTNTTDTTGSVYVLADAARDGITAADDLTWSATSVIDAARGVAPAHIAAAAAEARDLARRAREHFAAVLAWADPATTDGVQL